MKAHSDDDAKTCAIIGDRLLKKQGLIKIDVTKAQVRRRLSLITSASLSVQGSGLADFCFHKKRSTFSSLIGSAFDVKE